MNAYGDSLSVLADVCPGGDWSVAVCPAWNQAPYPGFGFEDCEKRAGQDGYTRVVFKNKKLTELEISSFCLKFRLNKTRLYAMNGELVRQSERYYEGAGAV